jgi:hypothetical protein
MGTSTTKVRRCGYPCDHLIEPDGAAGSLRTISYGGGVQSTALMVLAAQGRINYRTFLFSNVGDDSEHPDTLKYVEHVARPFAAYHELNLQTLQRVKRDGSVETLWGRLMDPKVCPDCKGQGVWEDDGAGGPCVRCDGAGKVESRSLPIPVRMSNGAPGNRSCTSDFKIKVIARWLKAHGATEANPATVGIGISLDEIGRANSRFVEPYERVVYPLVGIGEETGLKLRRDDCMRLIRETPLPEPMVESLRAAEEAGPGLLPPSTLAQLRVSNFTRMPVPPKSSCFFCPFHKPGAWQDLARETPELFDRSVRLEQTLNERREMLGKDHVYLTRFAMPLAEAIDTDADLLPLFDESDGSCESGYCFT